MTRDGPYPPCHPSVSPTPPLPPFPCQTSRVSGGFLARGGGFALPLAHYRRRHRHRTASRRTSRPCSPYVFQGLTRTHAPRPGGRRGDGPRPDPPASLASSPSPKGSRAGRRARPGPRAPEGARVPPFSPEPPRGAGAGPVPAQGRWPRPRSAMSYCSVAPSTTLFMNFSSPHRGPVNQSRSRRSRTSTWSGLSGHHHSSPVGRRPSLPPSHARRVPSPPLPARRGGRRRRSLGPDTQARPTLKRVPGPSNPPT